MIGTSSSSISWIFFAAVRWDCRSSAATYSAASLSYSLFLKWAEFQVPSLFSGEPRNTFGTPRCPYSVMPNVFLGAPLKSDGVWNSAHFKNKEYDKLANEYVAALDLQSQRTAAKKIQEMLLDEVPIMISYFYFYLSALKPTIAGVNVSAMGHVDVTQGGVKA